MSIDLSKFRTAIGIIGVNISTYGHFDTYMIPNEFSHGITEQEAKADPEKFLFAVQSYYKSSKVINKDYGDDLKKQNAVKKFILRKDVTEKDLNQGMEWVSENLF